MITTEPVQARYYVEVSIIMFAMTAIPLAILIAIVRTLWKGNATEAADATNGTDETYE